MLPLHETCYYHIVQTKHSKYVQKMDFNHKLIKITRLIGFSDAFFSDWFHSKTTTTQKPLNPSSNQDCNHKTHLSSFCILRQTKIYYYDSDKAKCAQSL